MRSAAYVELIRNTPFLVQLFFIFFGLPSLGIRLDPIVAAILAMTLNMAAYTTEIVGAGLDAVPRGQREAALALGLRPRQVFVKIVLPQALKVIFPALTSQIVIMMLESAVVSQIAVRELTYEADMLQARTFRAFETYLVVTLVYLGLSIALRRLLVAGGRRASRERRVMIEFTLWDIVRNLLLAARWTVLLSLVAFVGGGIVGLADPACCASPHERWLRRFAQAYIGLFQGTPLLMQLFLMFFGLPMLGFRIEPWTAAVLGLTFFASAYLAEIWRGGVEALPRGQWDAGASLGLHYHPGARLIILPQAFAITRAPTVGFLVQLIKSTALTSIIGFEELMRTSNAINNATFEPFTVYGLVALIFFVAVLSADALCPGAGASRRQTLTRAIDQRDAAIAATRPAHIEPGPEPLELGDSAEHRRCPGFNHEQFGRTYPANVDGLIGEASPLRVDMEVMPVHAEVEVENVPSRSAAPRALRWLEVLPINDPAVEAVGAPDLRHTCSTAQCWLGPLLVQTTCPPTPTATFAGAKKKSPMATANTARIAGLHGKFFFFFFFFFFLKKSRE